MNLNSKLKQGWLQLLQNEKQLFSTTRNANSVARIEAAVKQNLKCQRRNRRHVECQPARKKKDEQAVQDLQSCMTDFEAEPFDKPNATLRSLQSVWPGGLTGACPRLQYGTTKWSNSGGNHLARTDVHQNQDSHRNHPQE